MPTINDILMEIDQAEVNVCGKCGKTPVFQIDFFERLQHPFHMVCTSCDRDCCGDTFEELLSEWNLFN